MIYNRLLGIVEEYNAETDSYELVYDPKTMDPSRLGILIETVRKEERKRFAKKLQELGKEFDY
jgi:hypothetical protein